VQLGPGVRLGDADDGGDLGVAEAGEELERDQLALARLEAGEAGGQRQAPLAGLGALVGRSGDEVGRLRRQLGLAAAAAQLVEGGVAGDPEQPGAGLAAAGVEARALAVGALEGGGRYFLGRRRVAHEAGHVGVDVVAARPVEAVEGEVGLAWRLLGGGGQSPVHALTTTQVFVHHRETYMAKASCPG
jgi:hypothetical protein